MKTPKIKQLVVAISFWERMKPSNQASRPCIAEELPDGTFVVGWTTLHVAGLMEERLQMIRARLEANSKSSTFTAMARV